MELRGETRDSQDDANVGRIYLNPESADGVHVTHESEIRSP